MIAPHQEGEDIAVNLPLLIEQVAGNTPVKIDGEAENKSTTISTSVVFPTGATTISKTIVSTNALQSTTPSVTSSTTKSSFLLPITG